MSSKSDSSRKSSSLWKSIHINKRAESYTKKNKINDFHSKQRKRSAAILMSLKTYSSRKTERKKGLHKFKTYRGCFFLLRALARLWFGLLRLLFLFHFFYTLASLPNAWSWDIHTDLGHRRVNQVVFSLLFLKICVLSQFTRPYPFPLWFWLFWLAPAESSAGCCWQTLAVSR